MTTSKADAIGATRPIHEFLVQAAENYPRRTALRFEGATITYCDLLSLVRRIATSFRRRGIGPGQRVGLLMPNHPAFVAMYYAALASGAAVVCLNPLYAVPALQEMTADADLSLIATLDDEDLRSKAEALSRTNGLSILLCEASGREVFGTREAVLVEQFSSSLIRLRDWIDQPAEDFGTPTDVDADLAVLQYTGGTTGKPKAAALTHSNLSSNLIQLRQALPRLQPGEECFLAAAPFCHITGMNVVMNLGVSLAATLEIMPRFDPLRAAEHLENHAVTFLVGVPTMYIALLDSASSGATTWMRLKYAISGGAPLPNEIYEHFDREYGLRLLQGYGLSECSPAISLVPAEGDVPPNSVGMPVRETTIEIRCLDDPSRRVLNGEIGEICVAGPQVTRQYWRRPDETAACLVEGFFRTGDIGRVDQRGFVHIVDRIKDIVIAGGYNVYPTRVEDAIYRHPAILEAAVVGIPDRYRGETVKAFVALKRDETLTIDELRIFLKPLLSPIEIPKQLEILPALPKTAVGKVSRLAVRDMARAAGNTT